MDYNCGVVPIVVGRTMDYNCGVVTLVVGRTSRIILRSCDPLLVEQWIKLRSCDTVSW